MTATKRHGIPLLDIAVLNLFFFVLHYFSQGTLRLAPPYVNLLALMNGSWVIVSYFTRKFSLAGLVGYRDIAIRLPRTALLMLSLTSLTLVIWDLRDFARLHILGAFGLLWLAEMVLAGIWYPRLSAQMEKAATRRSFFAQQSLPVALLDLFLYLLLFLAVHQFKYDTLVLEPRSWMMAGIGCGMWLLSAEWTGKFVRQRHANFYFIYEPFVKAAFIMAAAAAVLIYSFQLFSYSRTLVLAPVLLLLLAEAPLALIWLRIRSAKTEEGDVEDAAAVSQMLEEDELVVTSSEHFQEAARYMLQNHYPAGQPTIFRLLVSRCDLNAIELSAFLVLNSHAPTRH